MERGSTAWASVVAAPGLQSHFAELLCGMWDIPGLGFKPASPALQGRFLTTGPVGKPLLTVFPPERVWIPKLVASLRNSRERSMLALTLWVNLAGSGRQFS